MSSLERLAGELLIDHRASPGTPSVPEGTVLESATYTCIHCCRIVIKEFRRTRDRAVCLKCMAIICDECDAARAHGSPCAPFMAQYYDKPNVILSVAGAPARTTPSGLMLPGQITR